jgi:hypothetical protein
MRGYLNEQQRDELEPSWCSQLDRIGMQPHSREFLEREMNCIRSWGKFECLTGETMDDPTGIHFGDTP